MGYRAREGKATSPREGLPPRIRPPTPTPYPWHPGETDAYADLTIVPSPTSDFPQDIVGNTLILTLKSPHLPRAFGGKGLGASGAARRGAGLRPVSVLVALGSAPGGGAASSPWCSCLVSLFACVGFVCVWVSVWVFVVAGFFLNKEKKMCIFLAMTET